MPLVTTLDLPRNSCSYNIGKTNTFRSSSSEILGEWGTNLQNINKGLRSIYVADKGYKLLQRDQSGAEALVVAYLCKPGKFRDLFIQGIKPHSYVALHMFKDKWKPANPSLDVDGLCSLLPAQLRSHADYKKAFNLIKSSDDWPANERYYYLAKQTCHSANYGITANRFRINVLEKSEGLVALTKKDAEFFLSFYRSTFPEIPEWNYEVYKALKRYGVLYNLFGHPREFTKDLSMDTHVKDAYAFIPQSTVGEITHVAFREVQSYIERTNKNWHLLTNTHDSLLIEFPDDASEQAECVEVTEQAFAQEFTSPVDGAKFTMKSEVAVGYNWGPWKKDKNEKGLKEI